MTEIPEHLLERSRARRAALGLGGGDAAPAAASGDSAAPVAASAKAPAKAAASAPVVAAKKPEVVQSPEVRAANARKKIPWWAAPVLFGLPLWSFLYVQTLSPPGATSVGALAEGEIVYARCAGCHGASGGGAGAIPALTSVLVDFPDPAQQVEWIAKGSEGFKAIGTYGATGKPVNGGMPSWADALSAKELMSVVMFTRVRFGGAEEADLAQFEAATESTGLPAKIPATITLEEIGLTMIFDPRSGDVSFTDRPGFQYEGFGSSASGREGLTFNFDLNDGMHRRHGSDPRQSERRWLMSRTQAFRDSASDAAVQTQAATAGRSVRGRLQRILDDEARPIESRRAQIFRTWDQCSEEEVGLATRRAIIAFVRERLPAGSANAFTSSEIARLNGGRRSTEAFAPY